MRKNLVARIRQVESKEMKKTRVVGYRAELGQSEEE
jgi:hypothetical protein